MRFSIQLTALHTGAIPINYAYPLSAALYRILAKGDAAYATFLHESGYGKGFKFFSFSDVQVPFKRDGDRLRLTGSEASFQIGFQLPQAMESFVKGLFQSESIEIADRKSKVSFAVKSVERLPDPLQEHHQNEIVNVIAKPLSPVVAGLQNDRGHYGNTGNCTHFKNKQALYNKNPSDETLY
ncbi:hypothetical protein ABDK00_001280 [Niabella insulamsoli]|uniref:hypothetical protein n=1 Tax=Niabella insulamsoli TaxID=3144874 RepID=UPI0031FDCBE4